MLSGFKPKAKRFKPKAKRFKPKAKRLKQCLSGALHSFCPACVWLFF
jgi:hypothetical protein